MPSKLPARSARNHGHLRPPLLSPGIVISAVILGISYNAILAFLNAHGVRQSFATVSGSEIVLLSSTAFVLLLADAFDRTALAIILYGVLTSLFVTIASQSLSVDFARITLIISIFYTMGKRIDEPLFHSIFRFVSVIVLAGLVLELVSTPAYVQIFQPASYYSATRGVKEFSLDSSGLFRNALGFQGRFSFGLASHRTASIFIEQVSLANFAGVLTIFILSRFPRLTSFDRVLHVGLLVLILVTNDTRTSSILAAVSLVGYFIYPFLDASISLLVLPSILGSGLLVSVLSGSINSNVPTGDDAKGRIGLTMNQLANFDVATIFGFNARIAPTLLDSGYAYVIAISSVFGLVALWLALVFLLAPETPSQRRCSFGLSLYFFCNLMIGGTAVFSIKVAAPLWLLVGFMANRPRGRVASNVHVANRAPNPTLAGNMRLVP